MIHLKGKINLERRILMTNENVKKIGMAGIGLFLFKNLLTLVYYLPEFIRYNLPGFIFNFINKVSTPLVVISAILMSVFFYFMIKSKKNAAAGVVGLLMCLAQIITLIVNRLINGLLNNIYFDYELYDMLTIIPGMIYLVFTILLGVLVIMVVNSIKNDNFIKFAMPLALLQFITILFRTSYINLQKLLGNYVNYSGFVLMSLNVFHYLSLILIGLIFIKYLMQNITNNEIKIVKTKESFKMNNRICNSCNTVIEGDSKFCSNCGQPLTVETTPVEAPSVEAEVAAEQVIEYKETVQPKVKVNVQTPSKFCSHCGNLIHVQAVVCPSCGCSVEGANVRTGNAGSNEKSNVVAGLLALFLGGFGIHKFYLGSTGMGVLYLLLTLFGGLLFFIPNLILGIVILVEAIMYFVCDNQKFNEKYNKNYGR